MSNLSAWVAPARRSLAGPVNRLCRTLDSLAKEVGEAIARAIGQAVSDAVLEAVRAVLKEPPYPQARSGWSGNEPVRAPPAWREPDEAYWDPYALEEPDDLLYEDRAGEQRCTRDTQESYRARVEPLPAGPRKNAWRRALKAGCLAAAWWLRRPPGRFSVLIALGVGLVAGLAALICGPLAAVGAGAAGSAFVFLGLADALHYGSPWGTESSTH
jgi:hypothetical protein